MPLELGLFLGCKRFDATTQRKKACLIFGPGTLLYRKFISDIPEQDIHAHIGDPEEAITELRSWLRAVSKPQRPLGRCRHHSPALRSARN